MDKGMLFVWLIQLAIMAMFDTRRDTLNKILNLSILIASLVITFIWGGFFWLIVPLLVIPVIGGLIAGIVTGLIEKNKRNKEGNK